jgi:outer membrane protein OmpA-like peptidoglycan-associated protein
VRDYFIGKGISADRILAQGFGSSRHISKDGDKKENPEDRRVELILF